MGVLRRRPDAPDLVSHGELQGQPPGLHLLPARLLEKWDFAGVDIDWEWPGSDTRGGNAAIDKQNQVYLMKELRAALGSRGLSVVLPAQYAYLQMMDPKALEGSVDAFNVLAYDLHGVSARFSIIVLPI